jgi:hypothetical protein
VLGWLPKLIDSELACSGWKHAASQVPAIDHGDDCPADDLARFVSDTRYLQPAALDERAAMPALLELLPQLSDPKLVSAVAGHLRRPWARPVAFESPRSAFERWAPATGSRAGTSAMPWVTRAAQVICRSCSR